MGSAEFACPALELLLKTGRDEIVGVVSQPERPSDRHQKNKKCPLDEFASANSLRVLTPENINTPESVEALRALKPDLIIVVAYGQILKPPVLTLASKGCINLHGSLLPKYRGAAPIQWAIANGEQQTGVTTMFINEKMDAGDIIAQEKELILPDDTSASLGRRLADKGAKLLMETIEMIRRGNAPRTKQNEDLVSYAPRLKKNDGLIDWNRPARELSDRIRGFQPWPCCFFTLLRQEALRLATGRKGVLGFEGFRQGFAEGSFTLKDKTTVRVLRARVESDGSASPGTILEAHGDGPLIQTGSGSLRLLEVQPEGRKPMSGNAFLCGNKMAEGERVV